jgi:predicted outer membrane protein
MSIKMSLRTGFYAAGVCCLLSAAAFAQQANPGIDTNQFPLGQPNTQNPSNSERNGQRDSGKTFASGDQSANGQQGEQLNYAIAACLLDHNKAEVELAKMAVEHSKNDEVKQFAEQMVKDHSQMVDKLQQFVGSHEPNDRRSQIERRINERCAESMRKELESKTGHEFDAAYVGSQIGGHMQMLAAVEVLSDETSGDLQSMVKDAKPVVEKHLKQAKDLMEKSNTRQASRTRDDSSR